MTPSLMVFTRDLRVHDNPALAAAAGVGPVVPLFVLDDAIISRHEQNPTRLSFLLGSLRDLDGSLRGRGGRLVVRRGPWAKTVVEVAGQAGAGQIHLMDDVSGYAAARLARLRDQAGGARLEVRTHPGVLTAGPDGLSPAGGGPYQVFTPYYRRWLQVPRRDLAPAPGQIDGPAGIDPGSIPRLADLTPARRTVTPPEPGETGARKRLAAWSQRYLAEYEANHDDLAADKTARLSPYLHLGCLSPLAVVDEVTGKAGAESFIRQIAWRDFFAQLLAARPEAAHQDYRPPGGAGQGGRPGGARRRWNHDPDGLAAWKDGQTGYPVVDAAMRQLSAEGFMHNRARMIVASFLTKDLRIDWREGAAHFMARLADADVASNQLNWQWVAGTGTDPQRHRMFNPTRQGQRFDPGAEYIRRYVPELDGVPAGMIHDPPPALRVARGYPQPILDHVQAVRAWRSLGQGQAGR
ncbi:MAG: cryptochrome/photolyase family protein [Streptosporangiaceae bacterium]